MDLMSLGQRLNWGQLVAFTGSIEDGGTLHRLADAARGTETQVPVLFAAVELSGQPALVADYLSNHGSSGMGDLASVLPYGSGSLDQMNYPAQLLGLIPIALSSDAGRHSSLWRILPFESILCVADTVAGAGRQMVALFLRRIFHRRRHALCAAAGAGH